MENDINSELSFLELKNTICVITPPNLSLICSSSAIIIWEIILSIHSFIKFILRRDKNSKSKVLIKNAPLPPFNVILVFDFFF